jgi:hypothetical protein
MGIRVSRRRESLACIPLEVRIASAATDRPSQWMAKLFQAHYDMADEYPPDNDVFSRAAMLYDRVLGDRASSPASHFREHCTRFVRACDVELRRSPSQRSWSHLIRTLSSISPDVSDSDLKRQMQDGPLFSNDALRSHVPYQSGSSDMNADHLIEFQFIGAIVSATLPLACPSLVRPGSPRLELDAAVARMPWLSVLLASLSSPALLAPMDSRLNQAKRGAWRSFVNRMFDAPGMSIDRAAAASSSSHTGKVVSFFHRHAEAIERAVVHIARDVVEYCVRHEADMDQDSKRAMALVVLTMCRMTMRAFHPYSLMRTARMRVLYPGFIVGFVLALLVPLAFTIVHGRRNHCEEGGRMPVGGH